MTERQTSKAGQEPAADETKVTPGAFLYHLGCLFVLLGMAPVVVDTVYFALQFLWALLKASAHVATQ